jgi:hypothetical protein
MMLFDTPAAGARYVEGIAAALRGGGRSLHEHPHTGKPPLWKALACMAAQTGRCDLAAVMRVIGVLLARPAADEAVDALLEALRSKLNEAGVHFLGIDDDHVRFAVHGQERPPASARQLGEMLGEIRQAWQA